MAKTKNQNSILFLATLGVYLGLVLVGATPQVVAQRAAMARTFDIKDEIEKKDEFDGNPDIEELKALITDSLERTLVGFLQDVQESPSDSALRRALSTKREIYSGYSLCPDGFDAWGNGRDVLRGDPLSDLHLALDPEPTWTPDTLPKIFQPQRPEKCGKAFVFETSIDDNAFSIQFAFSRSNSAETVRLATYLNDYLTDRSAYFQDPIRTEIYRGTRATSQTISLVIITRLPRGSLEALLTKDAK